MQNFLIIESVKFMFKSSGMMISGCDSNKNNYQVIRKEKLKHCMSMKYDILNVN